MTKEELAEKITGENLDSIMNIDPRGYGVSRILYKASRKYADNKSTSMTFAKKICSIFSNADKWLGESLIFVNPMVLNAFFKLFLSLLSGSIIRIVACDFSLFDIFSSDSNIS